LLIIKGFSVNAHVFFQALPEVPQKIASLPALYESASNNQFSKALFKNTTKKHILAGSNLKVPLKNIFPGTF
jgi:hypothetical protein